MIVLYMLGWLFLAGAFLGAAAETVVRGRLETDAVFLTAHELWSALAPESLAIAQYMVERNLSPAIWDPLLVNLMTLPAWLILGIPGVLLVWFFRPPRKKADSDDDDIMEESLFLFDALAEEAGKEGYHDDLPVDDGLSLNYESEGLTTNFESAGDTESWDPAADQDDEGEYDSIDFPTSPPADQEDDGDDGEEEEDGDGERQDDR